MTSRCRPPIRRGHHRWLGLSFVAGLFPPVPPPSRFPRLFRFIRFAWLVSKDLTAAAAAASKRCLPRRPSHMLPPSPRPQEDICPLPYLFRVLQAFVYCSMLLHARRTSVGHHFSPPCRVPPPPPPLPSHRDRLRPISSYVRVGQAASPYSPTSLPLFP